MRPPVLWADRRVEQIRHRLKTKLREMSQQDNREGFDVGIQILQISGGRFARSDSTCVQHKPCYNRARLEIPRPAVKRKKAQWKTPSGKAHAPRRDQQAHSANHGERRTSLSQNR